MTNLRNFIIRSLIIDILVPANSTSKPPKERPLVLLAMLRFLLIFDNIWQLIMETSSKTRRFTPSNVVSNFFSSGLAFVATPSLQRLLMVLPPIPEKEIGACKWWKNTLTLHSLKLFYVFFHFLFLPNTELFPIEHLKTKIE